MTTNQTSKPEYTIWLDHSLSMRCNKVAIEYSLYAAKRIAKRLSEKVYFGDVLLVRDEHKFLVAAFLKGEKVNV